MCCFFPAYDKIHDLNLRQCLTFSSHLALSRQFLMYYLQAELQNHQHLGETADDSFKAVFGNEQPGRVRCYGRSVTRTSLKKDEEIIKIKQKHADEINSFKEEVKELKEEVVELRKLEGLKEEVQELQQLRHLMKLLVKNNPGLNLEDAEGFIGSNQPSPVDSSSARATRGQNLPRSSGSTHGPTLAKVLSL